MEKYLILPFCRKKMAELLKIINLNALERYLLK